MGFIRTNYRVTSAEIMVSAVTADDIAASSIASYHLQQSCITSDKIAQSAITSDDIAQSAVGTDEIAESAVTTAKIAESAITTAKIAASAITSTKIGSSAVLASHLVSSALDNIIFVATFSSSTDTSGIVCLAHGLSSTPTNAFANLVMAASTIAAGVWRQVFLQGIGATYVTFFVASFKVPAATAILSAYPLQDGSAVSLVCYAEL